MIPHPPSEKILATRSKASSGTERCRRGYATPAPAAGAPLRSPALVTSP